MAGEIVHETFLIAGPLPRLCGGAGQALRAGVGGENGGFFLIILLTVAVDA